MLEQFLNHIDQNNLIESDKDTSILLAVSGGLDSMVMLDLFLKSRYSIAVAHCNFQLRANESDEDEKFVSDYCDNRRVPFFSMRFDTESYSHDNKLSIQMAARELRYAWFHELLETHAFNRLATAHHLNDSMETVLLNWIKGQSLDGFSGIPIRNGKVIRPMLFASREHIKHYALANSITWREDRSNQTDDYQRNYIRSKVIPMLREINPDLESAMLRSMKKVKADLDLLGRGFEAWRREFISEVGETLSIQKAGLQKLPYAAGVLWRCLSRYGFTFEICENAVAAMASQPGKKFIGPSHNLINDREHLILKPIQKDPGEVHILSEHAEALLGQWKLSIHEFNGVYGGSEEAVLDADKIQFPLVWRPWKQGDHFYPLGMEHRKKISDFLIDEKVSMADKPSVTVLESGDAIIWLVGYRIDNRFKITEETTRKIVLRVAPHFM